MKKQNVTLNIAIIILIVAGIVVGIILLYPGIIFFWCMITDDGGKLHMIREVYDS